MRHLQCLSWSVIYYEFQFYSNYKVDATIKSLKTELCYHVEVDGAFGDDKVAILQWILKEPQQVDVLSRTSVWDIAATSATEFIIEIGPRFANW